MPSDCRRTERMDALRPHLRTAGPRALIVVVAALAVALNGPSWLLSILSAVAFLVTAERLVRRRQLDWADAATTAAAGLIIVLMLLGFLLNVLPGGLGRVSWAIGAGVLALAAIVWGQRQTAVGATTPNVDRRIIVWLAPAYALAAVLAAAALIVSVHATDEATRAPLSLAIVGHETAGRVTVEVSGARTSGRYELQVDDGSAGSPHVYGPFALSAGGHATRTIQVAEGHRTVVALRASGASRTVRSLVIDGRSG